jgi:hypothetical protein
MELINNQASFSLIINAASSAKLYPELNLTEETLRDGIKYHNTSILLTV